MGAPLQYLLLPLAGIHYHRTQGLSGLLCTSRSPVTTLPVLRIGRRCAAKATEVLIGSGQLGFGCLPI